MAERLPAAFDQAFSEFILPKIEGTRAAFKKEAAPMYVTERREDDLADVPATEPPYDYEAALEILFWGEGTHTLIFVQGPIGSGKSTLIDYYLRCYCPYQGLHQAEFAHKLIIEGDFRSTPSAAEFDKRLYAQARQQIRQACEEISFHIETEDNYEFWDPIFEFGSDTFVAAQGAEDATTFRKAFVNNHKPNVTNEDWVHAALRFLSMKAGSSVCRYQYLVLCLDNLDQSDVEVLQHAIYRVREWTKLAGRMRLWRVFIPVVPGTLSLIVEQINPLPSSETLHINPPKLQLLLDRRSDVLEAAVDNATEQPSETSPGMRAFIRDCRGWANPRFHGLLSRVSAGSARTSLQLWRCVMSSKSLYETYTVRVGNPSSARHLGQYSLLSGMLTAQYSHFRPDHHPLLNIFNLLPESATERDLLIGLHAAALLNRNMSDYSGLVATLQNLGYGMEAIDAVLRVLKSRRFFGELKQRAIHPEQNVIKGYFDLITEQSYIEQVSQITPLELPQSEQLRLLASGASKEDPFVTRVRTAIVFLSQLKQDEERFCKVDALPLSADREEFMKVLRRGWIPSVFRICATKYLERLVWIRDHDVYPGVSSLTWDQLIRHSVLVAGGTATSPLRPME